MGFNEEKTSAPDESEKILEEKKEKLKRWLKDPHRLILIGIIILTIAIRLYYFSLTKTQPLWWDEADYMAYAKNLAGFNGGWMISPQHNSLFPFIVAFLFRLSFSEPAIKFILEIIPSILVVFLTYKVVTFMYSDKRIALISAFLMATFWNVLFNSMRFHLGVPSLLFALLAFYTFWKGYERKEKIFRMINSKWAIPLTVFFVILSYSIRRGYFLFGLFFLVYMLSTRNFQTLIRDKYNWIGLAIAGILIMAAEKFVFIAGKGMEGTSEYINVRDPISFFPLSIFKTYFASTFLGFPNILLYLFWIGMLVMLFTVILSFGHMKKIKHGNIKGDLFSVIMVVITLAFFIFILRAPGLGDPRWYYPLLLSSFVAISRGTLFIADILKKYSKLFSIFFIVLLIGYGSYGQIQHADQIIKIKANSFNGVKQVSLFIQENSNQEDIIFSIVNSQPSYYAERKVISPYQFFPGLINSVPTTLEMVLPELEKKENDKIRYIIVTFSEPNHPEWMIRNGKNKIEIPFMDTTIDFATGQQDIKQAKTYGNLTFNLVMVQEDAFLYEIIRGE